MKKSDFLYGNGKTRIFGVSDDYTTNSSDVVASTKCVYELNKKIELTGKLPLGHFFLHPFPIPPDGCLVVNGSEYNRELYKDLWADVQIKGQYKTEAEWQSIAAANGGYCPWYSDGDGSTTFRTPKFAPYQKIALASGNAGKYYEAGLPTLDNISFTTEYILSQDESRILSSQNGKSFDVGSASALSSNVISFVRHPTSGYSKIKIKRDTYSEIYGSSDTVTPESHDWIICAVAFGTATNVGSVDVANVMSAVGQVQAEVATKLEDSTVHVIEAWKSADGDSWYRKWSDGFIEQGGHTEKATGYSSVTITLVTNMTTNTYNIQITSNRPSRAADSVDFFYDVTTTGFKAIIVGEQPGLSARWYACGY